MMRLYAGSAIVGLIAVLPARAMKPDQSERMFPIYVPTGLPVGCKLPGDGAHVPENDGLFSPGGGSEAVADPTEFPPFRQMLCSSAILQYHYARRERRSQHFASVLDGLTFGAAATAAALSAFGAPARAVLAAGLTGGIIAVGRN